MYHDYVMLVSDNLTDFTYHLINAMKEAEKDPDDRKAIKLLTEKHYVYTLLDMFSGKKNYFSHHSDSYCAKNVTFWRAISWY